jgi:TRAP-type C4-dicarboxylate transport system permease small subunit
VRENPDLPAHPEDVGEAGLTFAPKLWQNASEIVSMLLLLLMTTCVVAAVFYRYVLNQPLSWADPLSRYSMIWLVFMGSVVAVKRNAHLIVEVPFERLPPTLYRWATGLTLLVQLAIILILGQFGWEMASANSTRTSVPHVTWRHIYAAVPTGCALMAWHTTRHLIRHLRGSEA